MAKMKHETIVQMFKRYRAINAYYDNIPVSRIKPCISTGNKKIGHVLNVSLMPIMTCGNCKGCFQYCYDVKACAGKNWKTVLDARVRNTTILNRNRDAFFAHIQQRLTRSRTYKFFRWHVAGDIIDADYFSRIIDIVRNNPGVTFWIYTKRFDIVNEYVREHGSERSTAIPDNFKIMYSAGFGDDIPNPYHFPLFYCVLRGQQVPDGYYHCPGNCDACKPQNGANAKGCIAGVNTWNAEH